MVQLGQGMLAGILAGIIMGIVSDGAFRLKIFRSSLLLVDGNFLFRFSRRKPTKAQLYAAGIPIHLVTSGVFGGVYAAGTSYLGLAPLSPSLVAAYFGILYLSMLFIALPIAGQGLAGSKAHSSTWFEQLILHIIFGAGYFNILANLMA
jgi:hypothetical protein